MSIIIVNILNQVFFKKSEISILGNEMNFAWS